MRRALRWMAAYLGVGVAWATLFNVLGYRNDSPLTVFSMTPDGNGLMVFWAAVLAPVLFWPVYLVAAIVLVIRRLSGG